MEKISATKLVGTLAAKKTKATITFTKKNGQRRVMDCIPTGVDTLGYLTVNELPLGETKKVDTRKIISAVCGSKEYVVS